MIEEITPDEQVEWSQYEPVPVGLYEAEIIKIEKMESPFEKGKPVYQFHFRLNYKNSQGEEVVIRRMISKKLSPKSKLFELVTALDSKEPDKKKYPRVAPTTLLGKKCKVMIRHKEDQKGNTWARIESFLPLNSRSEAPQSPKLP